MRKRRDIFLNSLPSDQVMNMSSVSQPIRNRSEIGKQNIRRGARVVESDGLENRCARKCTVGSNPTLSAPFIKDVRK
jgi:hypothetical protein